MQNRVIQHHVGQQQQNILRMSQQMSAPVIRRPTDQPPPLPHFRHEFTLPQQHISQPIYENLPPIVNRVKPVPSPPVQSLKNIVPTPWRPPTTTKTVSSTDNNQQMNPPMLSVSGKKKCSHCGRELGQFEFHS
jgi:hypothetical protein